LIGRAVPLNDALAGLMARPSRYDEIDADLAALRRALH
jgi:hypothetical protein